MSSFSYSVKASAMKDLRYVHFVTLVLAAIAALVVAVQAQENPKKIINCYWAHRSESFAGNNRFTLNDLDPYLCTHITYAAVGLNASSWTVKAGQGPVELDPVNGTYKRFNDLKLKNPNLKTLLVFCVGGSTSKFKLVVADPKKREVFIKSVVDWLTKYNFDGFDIDWEYPGAEDKDNFMILLKEMRIAFNNADRKLLMSVAVGHNPSTIRGAYDAKIMSDTLDYINVMTYDYHGYSKLRPWTQLNMPLYGLPKDRSVAWNSAYAMEYWVQQGADPTKLLIGIPAYGMGFILKDPNQFSLFAPAVGKIPNAFNYSRGRGTWNYNEYCERMQTESDEWKVYRNSRVVSPYVVNGLNWLGIEDAISAKIKAEYVRDMGMGGAMIWTLNGDDFRGFCGEKFGLINAIKEVFNTLPYP